MSGTCCRHILVKDFLRCYNFPAMKNINLSDLKHIHFIGIGGINMSSLAELSLKKNIKVSGSDAKQSDLTDELSDKGAIIYIGQRAENITDDVDLVVYTAAISEENPELKSARELGKECMSRADYLGLLMKNYKTAVCVSGTHGKTTTTSLISQVLLDTESDPTIMVGGILPSIGGNTRIGDSDTLLTEACEYTNSFLSFFPTVEVILNVQADHLDFFKDLDDIRHSFMLYTRLLPENGTLVINGEIDNLSYFTDGLKCPYVTFGLDKKFDFSADNIGNNDRACEEFDLYYKGEFVSKVSLNICGRHNVYNALAAIAAAKALNIPFEKAIASVEAFTGVDRRFELKGEFNGCTVIDDYAHHPDEINATISAALNYPHKKLYITFQPHTYTRTKAFLNEFADALARADVVVLTDIFAAREVNTIGISSEDIQKLILGKGTDCYYFNDFEGAEKYLSENCAQGDLLITMGAGNVNIIGERLLSK